MSVSSSSSDSEGSSSSEELPQVTTHTERIIRRYQIKKSLILERIFAIEQVILGLFLPRQKRAKNVGFRTMRT